MNAEIEDQKSIDDLPIEMLEEVFLTLDFESLKNCCLVNKKWNNVIGQSSSIMENLPLWLSVDYKKSWLDIYHATKNYEHKIHTIAIDRLDVSDEYAIKTLNKFAAECRSIGFFECFFTNEISMESVKFPLLESAKISSAKNVEATRTIMKALSSSQLKHLSYEESHEGRSGFSEVLTFLSTQTKLTKLDLTFRDQKISLGCLSDIKRIQIPLKTLSLMTFNSDFEDPKIIVAFLSRFTETLEDLTFNFKCDSVFELIFTKFNKLKSLSLFIDFAPQKISFYNKLRPNHSVKKLVLVESFDSDNQQEETFNRFLGLLPNVETLKLSLSDIPDDTLLFVFNHLKCLTTLELDYVDSDDVENFARVRLPSVKNIVFGIISEVGHEQWKLIGDALPNIESMSIEYFDDAKSIEIIAKGWPNLNLTSLKFGYGFVAHDQIIIELLRNCKNIKTIEFEESAFESETSKAKILECVREHGIDLIVCRNY